MENQAELIMNMLHTMNMKLDVLMESKKEVKKESDLMNFSEACSYTKLGKSTLYKMAASNNIPFMTRKGSSKKIFSKIALTGWNTNTTSGPYNLKVDEYLHRNLRVQKEQKN